MNTELLMYNPELIKLHEKMIVTQHETRKVCNKIDKTVDQMKVKRLIALLKRKAPEGIIPKSSNSYKLASRNDGSYPVASDIGCVSSSCEKLLPGPRNSSSPVTRGGCMPIRCSLSSTCTVSTSPRTPTPRSPERIPRKSHFGPVPLFREEIIFKEPEMRNLRCVEKNCGHMMRTVELFNQHARNAHGKDINLTSADADIMESVDQLQKIENIEVNG